MGALAFYLSILVLLASAVGLTLCATAYGKYRHRSAFWLTICMAGLVLFAVMTLVSQLSASDAALDVGPNGVRLILHALGNAAIAIGLPRFVVAAFGSALHRATAVVFTGFATAVIALSVIRVVVNWEVSPAQDTVGAVIRVLNFIVLGGAFGSIVAFHARLPDRNLFRTVLLQLGALVLLLPFVYLEDVGLLAVSGFPHLSGQILMASVAASVASHAAGNLMRPKYIEHDTISDYFVSRFLVSDREQEVVACVLQGLDTRAIAERLFISHRTVEKHLYNIYQKTGVKSRIQLYNLLRSDS